MKESELTRLFHPDHVSTQAPAEQCPDTVVCEEGDIYLELGPCESEYCHCSNGIPLLEECAEGLYFNPQEGICDWPSTNPACDTGATERAY